MSGSVDRARSAALPALPLRRVFAVGLGNALEFYDFLTFSFFAVQIGHCFFPTAHGLLYSLATFGVGFLTRPLGGIVIGRFADRRGRKPAMTLSFVLMGIAITGLALTPSYHQIGVAAPALLVIFRLTQGFALGGEVGPSTAYLIEAAPPRQRGLYVALQYMTQDTAVLAAGLMGYGLSTWLDPAALDAWGWRAAFLVGALIVPLGLALRRSLPETLAVTTTDSPAVKAPALRLGWSAVRGLVMLGSVSVSLYVTDYVATYAEDSLKLTAKESLLAIVVLGVSTVIVDPLSGLLSDRVGRKPVMLAGAASLVVLTVPAFAWLNRSPSVGTLCAAPALLGALASVTASPVLTTVTESLPPAVRAGTVGTIYAVAVALFGGSTQLMVKALTEATKRSLAPAWYLTGAMTIGAIAMAASPESAPVRRRDDASTEGS